MRASSAGLGFFTAAGVVALALAVPAAAGPLGASAPLDISAGDPYAACPPIGGRTFSRYSEQSVSSVHRL